jgi:hypothetical protein
MDGDGKKWTGALVVLRWTARRSGGDSGRAVTQRHAEEAQRSTESPDILSGCLRESSVQLCVRLRAGVTNMKVQTT